MIHGNHGIGEDLPDDFRIPSITLAANGVDNSLEEHQCPQSDFTASIFADAGMGWNLWSGLQQIWTDFWMTNFARSIDNCRGPFLSANDDGGRQ